MKQVIVIRTDLQMRKGKMVAQGAHASLGAVLPYQGLRWRTLFSKKRRKVKRWLSGPFKKICLQVKSLEDLLLLEQVAKEAGLISCLITDSGLTEFNGVPTITCLAIGPDTQEAIDGVTGNLRLL
jgi:PTH2 family peptidyl-tRNA hydrolase